MTEKTVNQEWAGRDTVAVLMVGFFWLIAIIVVLTNKQLPEVKRYKIALYGTFIMMALLLVVGLLQS